MDWLLRIWIQIKIWCLHLLSKTTIDEKIIDAIKDMPVKVKKNKRGRKPKKK